MKIINQLTEGVPLIVTDPQLTPDPRGKYTVGDLITGYGVSEDKFFTITTYMVVM